MQRDLDLLQSIIETRGGFTHREHLELMWGYLQIYDPDAAVRTVASAIRRLALAHGAPQKYHETITRGWAHLVALHCRASEAESFDQFIAESPGLLDRHLLDRHYSKELLSSPGARAHWMLPDLQELPRVA
jgi:hypothetical protein